ncbi:MAG: twin-arginine translocation signal domain-containing protein [Gammaproteobacteria bacterium]
MDRRSFLKKAAVASLGSAAITACPAIIRAENRKPTIKVVGTHVTLQEPIRQQAEKDLGINKT